MKKNRFVTTLIAALILLVAIVAVIHLTFRTTTEEGHILVEVNGATTELPLEQLPLETVQGSVINGKGESRTIDAQGIAFSAILAEAGVTNFTSVSVVADDEYSADVTAEEISENGKVFLIISDEELPQLVVFGDENSKRNVSNVVRLIVV